MVTQSSTQSSIQSLSEEQYITSRLDDQIQWYDKKSGWNQHRYKILRVVNIVFAVLIPFCTGLIIVGNEVFVNILIGALGASVAIIEGVQGTYKFHENWIQYRTTTENLKHHKYMFLTKTGLYTEDDAFNRFVENVEGILAAENSSWASYVIKKPKTGEK